MSVELLAVGTELLLGDIVNTNAAWLGRRLAAVGLDVRASSVVGDNRARITEALRVAVSRADAVVITGGLGPTHDDLTREGLADLAGVDLVRDPALERELTERYAGYRLTVPESNYRQADVPRGAVPLPNPQGSAPGLRLELADRILYALPGVPHEMEAMFAASVLPDLLRRAGQPSAIVSRTLRVTGRWESEVGEALSDLIDRLEQAGNPTLALLAGGGEVRVRITAKAPDPAQARALIDPVERGARAALGEAVYGVDGETLPGVVHALLRAGGATVAAAESLTGGLLGGLLSQTPGSSQTYRGTVVAYATELKHQLLDVPARLLLDRGPVDAEVAATMAGGVRRRLGATYGVAVTGVAGPDPQNGHPPGTVYVGVAGPDRTRSHALRLPGDRPRIRQLAAVAALDALRRELVRRPGGVTDREAPPPS